MAGPPSLSVILFTALLFGLTLLQTFPINATDVYRYIIFGRVSSAFDQSPFAQPPDAFPQDPFLPLAGEWADETSPYGPLWETVSAAVTHVSQTDLYLGLLLFKAMGLFSHLATTFVIWTALAKFDPHVRLSRTLLWAWNPALLLTFVVDAHNDGLMILLLLLGYWVATGLRRPSAGFILMVLAALIKPIALLPLPIFFLSFWRQFPDAQARLRFTLISTLGSLLAVTLAFIPFGSPFLLVQRLLREASAGGGFSPMALLILVLRNWGINISLSLLTKLAAMIFGLFVARLIWLSWRGRNPLRSTPEVYAAYLLQALNFRVWYSVWMFPWTLMGDNGQKDARFRISASLWFLLTAQLSVLIFGHVRVYLLSKNHLLAHLIGVPFTFGLPLLLAVIGRHSRMSK